MASHDMIRMTRASKRDVAQRWTTIPATRIAVRALAGLIVMALAGCKDDSTGPLTDLGGISITPAAHTLTVGDSATFRIQHSFRGDSAVAVCGSSDTTRVTTRRQPGHCQVFAVAPGVATITAFLSSGQGVAGRVTVVAR